MNTTCNSLLITGELFSTLSRCLKFSPQEAVERTDGTVEHAEELIAALKKLKTLVKGQEMGIGDKYDALVPTSMPELIEFADRISKSSLIPREFVGKPADILVEISMGLEIGLKPVQALQSIAVINGRPSIWGSATRALVMASGQLQSLFETDPAEVKKTKKARCEIVRKGFAEPFIGEFSLDDARTAGLAQSNTYQKYLDQMLTWRAWHGAARKAFPDLYKGLAAAEELQETTPFNTPSAEAPSITLALDAPTETGGAPPSSDAQARERQPRSPSADASPKGSTPAGSSVNSCGSRRQRPQPRQIRQLPLPLLKPVWRPAASVKSPDTASTRARRIPGSSNRPRLRTLNPTMQVRPCPRMPTATARSTTRSRQRLCGWRSCCGPRIVAELATPTTGGVRRGVTFWGLPADKMNDLIKRMAGQCLTAKYVSCAG